LIVADLGFAKIGLSTCYDLRFPEFYAALRDKGAEMFLVPSAFTYKTGEAHWEILLRARAIENQCYVVAAAQKGKHNDKRESYGQSLIIDPWGQIVSQCSRHYPGFSGPVDDPNINNEICYGLFDREEVNKIRKVMPVNEHKRRDIYFGSKL
jgi:predicted amidohydrolase